MKRTIFLATLLIAATLLSSSCGVGDKIGSVSITAANTSGGFANLEGIGGTLQLTVNANYTSGKVIDETNFATYTVTPEKVDDNNIPLASPPQTITINNTGMLTAVQPAVCTWTNLGTVQEPSWFLTGYYQVVAHYRGFDSQPIFIGVASAASNSGDGTCGPTS